MAAKERSSIESTGSERAESGYQQSEVESQLHANAAAVEDQRPSGAPESTAIVAADRVKEISDVASTAVREIIEAAERSAAEMRTAASTEASATREAAERDSAELRRRAKEDARRLTEGSEREGRELVEKARVSAAAHLETVAAARSLLERFGVSASSLLAELDAFDPSATEPARAPAGDAVPWRAQRDPVAEAGGDPAGAGLPAGGPIVRRKKRSNGDAAAKGSQDAALGADPEARKAQKLSMTAFEMVIRGTPREEIAARLTKEFELDDDDGDLLERTLQQATAKGANWSPGRPPPPRRRGFLRR